MGHAGRRVAPASFAPDLSRFPPLARREP